jgi:hypothetical protein
MAINITNILNAITAKNNNADSTYSNFELSQINRAVNTINSENGVITFNSASDLPSGDSALIGQIAFIASPYSYVDSNSVTYNLTGSFYYYNGDSWSASPLTADSNFSNPYVAPIYPGTIAGYTSGGQAPAVSNVIQKYSFTADANATDVGDLISVTYLATGNSSKTHGYTVGNGPASNVIQKFPFAVDANATDVGDTTIVRARCGTVGNTSKTHGYTSGGYNPGYQDVIDKFSFSADENATDVGDLYADVYDQASQSSPTNGYISGGFAGPPISNETNLIQKFSFSTDTGSSDTLMDLTVSRAGPTGQSSEENGYSSGGRTAPTTYSDVIDKFSFSSTANATDVGDLLTVRQGTGSSSTTSGYVAGGASTPSSFTNQIQKFPFSSDANSTDIADLTNSLTNMSGHQV